MNWKIKAGVAVVVAGALAGGIWLILTKRSLPAVTVILRIKVTPAKQVDLVTGRGNSAQFKYLMGKQAGVNPALAQKLSLKPVPDSPLLEARIGVPTEEQGKRYVEVFVPTLQELCGRQAQLTLAEQSVR